MKKDNIVLNQYDSSSSSFKEITLLNALFKTIKCVNPISVSLEEGSIKIDSSIDTRVIVDNKIKDTNIFYKDDRVGIGRIPLHNYKFDIKVPENTLMTAFHVGDGKYGFSMGNGATQGFIPEIIGMGSGEKDAGLYFLGRAGNNVSSSIPLVIIDGRNYLNQTLTNRPIFGITNAQYDKYEFLIDQHGNIGIGKKPYIYKLDVNGSIRAADFILDSSVSMLEVIEIIIEQKNEIDRIKDKLKDLEKNITRVDFPD